MTASSEVLNIKAIKVSCHDCSLAELCLPRGLNQAEITELDHAIQHRRTIHRGDHLYRMGDRGRSVFVVRTGSIKTYLSTGAGDEQVVGFHLPGEILGLDVFDNEQYSSGAIALETSSVCELSGHHFEEICKTVPAMNTQMCRLVSREITHDHEMLLLLGKKMAEERLATFLQSLSERLQKRGLSGTKFNLSMSRQDMGNYLGLAVETISRLFARFQQEGILTVERRLVSIRNPAGLKSMISSHQHGQPVRSAQK